MSLNTRRLATLGFIPNETTRKETFYSLLVCLWNWQLWYHFHRKNLTLISINLLYFLLLWFLFTKEQIVLQLNKKIPPTIQYSYTKYKSLLLCIPRRGHAGPYIDTLPANSLLLGVCGKENCRDPTKFLLSMDKVSCYIQFKPRLNQLASKETGLWAYKLGL